MASANSHVRDAIERWEAKGLLDPVTAERLRRENAEVARSSERRWAQFALAATGAVVLVIAGFVFFAWIWPSVGPGGQSLVLAAVAGAGYALGRVMENRDRWIPAAYMLQASGLALLLIATAHSEEAWDRGTPGGMIAGFVALGAPTFAFLRSRRRNAVTPALEGVLTYVGLFLFLHRATTLDHDVAIWITDVVYVGSLAALLLPFRIRSTQDRGPWVRNTLLTALYCGLPLAFFTAVEPLDVDPEDAALALDLWLVIILLLGIRAVRASGSRPALEHRIVASCILSALVLAFWTLGGTLDLDSLYTALGGAAVGAAGLAYALPRHARGPTLASCVALVAASLYYGVEEAGTLGVVAALALSAVILFVVSVRLRSGGEPSGGID